MHISRERLEQKGWTDDEIDKALSILKEAEERSHPRINLLNKSVYWFALVLMIIGTIAFSLMILPLLMTVNNAVLYFILVIFGFTFGMMMSVLVRDIESLEKFHHMMVFSVVPVVGIVNFLIVVSLANNNFVADTFQVHHSPLLLALLYLVSFITPYFFMVFKKKWTSSI